MSNEPILTKAADIDPLSDFGKLAQYLQMGYNALVEAREHAYGARQVELVDRMLERHRAASAVLGVKVVS